MVSVYISRGMKSYYIAFEVDVQLARFRIMNVETPQAGENSA
jgi:hypothetical protein